jgi:hypothetical protein
LALSLATPADWLDVTQWNPGLGSSSCSTLKWIWLTQPSAAPVREAQHTRVPKSRNSCHELFALWHAQRFTARLPCIPVGP